MRKLKLFTGIFLVLVFVFLLKISVYMHYIQYKINFCMLWLLLGQYVIWVFNCIIYFKLKFKLWIYVF